MMNAVSPAIVACSDRAADVAADGVGDPVERGARSPRSRSRRAGRSPASIQRLPARDHEDAEHEDREAGEDRVDDAEPTSLSTPAASPDLLRRVVGELLDLIREP